MVSPIHDMVKRQLVGPQIVFLYKEKGQQDIYMVQSMLRENQSYNCQKNDKNEWYCDCHSFKYKSGVTIEGYCKHIRLIIFLIENNIKIEVLAG